MTVPQNCLPITACVGRIRATQTIGFPHCAAVHPTPMLHCGTAIAVPYIGVQKKCENY